MNGDLPPADWLDDDRKLASSDTTVSVYYFFASNAFFWGVELSKNGLSYWWMCPWWL